MTIHLTSAEYLILRRTLKTIFEYTDRSQVTADLLGIDCHSRATIQRILSEIERNRCNTPPNPHNAK